MHIDPSAQVPGVSDGMSNEVCERSFSYSAIG